MTKEVKLFINNQEVEFASSPDILFTFQVDEMTNPTVVKNSYSKSLVIPGTKQNNRIFGGIWNVERVQDIMTFNPSKKAPFTIYHNGEIYQTGYVKLLDININNNKIEYNVSLFGGLGDFFYSLMYSSSDDVGESEKKKLRDLHFGTNPTATTSADEFDFQINKDTVLDAWSHLSGGTSESMWNTINFAPLYNGLADGFDSDKVLINTVGNSKIKQSYVSGGTTYTPYENYVLADINNNYTEWQMRDLRSYLQRPVIRVKDIIGAICKPENNGGYEVELDPEFFSSGNPYYWKSWMTLPMLSNLDYDSTKESASGSASVNKMTQYYPSGYRYQQQEWFSISGMPEDAKSYNVSVDVDIQAILNSAYTSSLVTGSTTTAETNTIDITSYSYPDNVNYPSAIAVQLVAYDSDGRVCGGSDNIWITGVYQHRSSGGGGRGGRGGNIRPQPNNVIPSMADLKFTPVFENANTQQLLSYFNYVGDNKTRWQLSSGVSLTIKNVKKAWNVRLVLTKVNNSPSATAHDYYSRVLFQPYYTNTGVLMHRITLMDKFNVIVNSAEVTFNTNETIRSGSKFKKAQLLNTDYTPADWLLSYAKQFGLYFSKDKDANKIYIRTRKSFYDGNTIIDLNKMIDNSKQRTINPIVFDAKWYNWQLEQENSTFSKIYQDTYGVKYGSQKVNTGYNFDGNDNDLLNGNIFKGAIECLERSDMFTYTGNDTIDKPWQYQGFSYNLYSSTDIEESTEITVPATTRLNKLKSFQTSKFYDLFSKVQLHDDSNKPSDGSKILLFFDTFVPTKSKVNGEDINYWLTDDNNAMAVLNEDTPCWLYTLKSTNEATPITSIPHFGRYLINDGQNIITSSWDFGNVRQLYIPDVYSTQNATIYSQYWKKYISDLYDIDTKKLTCYVTFKGKPTEEWLRYFYWFENSIWRINKIIDHNVTSNDSTKVEFIKVQDITNYTVDDYQPLPNFSISFASGATSTTIPNSGGTVRVYVTINDQSLEWFVNDGILDYASPTKGVGNGYFDVTLPENTYNDSIVFSIACENGYDEWSNTINITQGKNILSAEFLQPYDIANLPASGGTAQLMIKSTYSWSITADKSFVHMSASSGSGEPANGEIIDITWDSSDSLSLRSTKFTISDSQGNNIYVYKDQDSLTNKGLSFKSSGGTIVINYTSGKSVIAPDWVTVTDNGNDTYTVVAAPNTSSERTSTIAFQGDDGVKLYYVGVTQEEGQSFNISPKVLEYGYTGGSQSLVITNPMNNEWKFVGQPSWITLSSISGSDATTVTATATENTTDDDRKGSVVFWNITTDKTYVVSCIQKKAPSPLTGITLDNLTWVNDVPSSGGVANKDNCSYTVIGQYADGSTSDITDFATVSGSLNVPESTDTTRHSIGTLTLTASYGSFTASTDVTAYQAAFVPYINLTPAEITFNTSGGTATINVESNIDWTVNLSGGTEPTGTVTGVSFSSITWTTDVPASGGTATKDNCTYIVTADYDNGNRVDITTLTPDEGLLVEGSKTVSASTDTSRHSVGSLSLDITYFPEFTATTPVYTATTAITVYQEAYEEPTPSYDIPLTFDIISSGTIYWKTTDNSFTKTISYSKDNGLTWNSIAPTESGTSISVESGDEIMFRGSNSAYSNGMSNYNNFSSSAGTKFNVRGNIMSLIDENNYTGITSISSDCFWYLFMGCTGLVSAEKLLLPITTLANGCYSGMFYGCTSLTTAPELPATTLAPYCYREMFDGCTSLTTAPELPAQLLVNSCYEYMFYDCTSLNYIKCLENGRDGSRVTNDWVSNVSATGTFIKNPNTTWSTGSSGIPSGWTVIDNS